MADNNQLQTTGNNGVGAAQPSTVKGFMALPSTQKRVKELLGERSSQFMTSISSMVGADDKLAACEPTSLFMACLTAAALDLPINKNLAFAHIVPYKNNSADVTEAQFQMGWKGYVQLAQRSGQYKKIAATEVYEGQLLEEDPLLGNSYDWKNKGSEKVVGYVAFIQLANGFEKELYMSKEEITKHADKYSKAYNHGRGFGPWKDNFDAMALKTVIKLLISKWGPMSVQMQRAVEVDSAVIKEDGNPEYIDGESLENVNASEDKKKAIIEANASQSSTDSERVHEVKNDTDTRNNPGK
jgi:recombination protein RecT